MPPIFERFFHVRHYECDSNGCLNQAVYLRLMQECAYDASASVGYGMLAYVEIGKSWYVRETDIEFYQPVHYGDTILVRTWVQDFHRVRSIRNYELYLYPENVLTAKAWSDWVYLDNSTGRPVTVPDQMILAFLPEHDFSRTKSRNRIKRQRFPAPPLNAGQIYIDSRQVEWRDLDPAKHVNNASYFNYLEECCIRAQEACGWSINRLLSTGYEIQTRKSRIDYRQSIYYGNLIKISTWISQVKDMQWIRHFQIHDPVNGNLILQALWHQVWKNRLTATEVPIPQDARLDFSHNIISGDYP